MELWGGNATRGALFYGSGQFLRVNSDIARNINTLYVVTYILNPYIGI
jgi:hypothetical protein